MHLSLIAGEHAELHTPEIFIQRLQTTDQNIDKYAEKNKDVVIGKFISNAELINL